MYVGEVSIEYSDFEDLEVLTLSIVIATSPARYHGKAASLS